jgi:hypothetical protein
MIGQHPQLAGLPELKLFSYPTIGELEASLPQYWIDRGITHRSPGLIRAIAEYKFRGQEADALERVKKASVVVIGAPADVFSGVQGGGPSDTSSRREWWIRWCW